MQRWLLAYVSALVALHLVGLVAFNTPVAQAKEGDWSPLASGNATLDARHVPPAPGYELPTSALEMVARTSSSDSPRFVAPSFTKTKAPSTTSRPDARSKTITSPFTKWVSPIASSTESDETESAEAIKIPKTTADSTAPIQVARRYRSSNNSRNYSSSRNRSTAPSSPTRSDDSTKTRSSSRSSVQAKPLTVLSFPTPKAELTSEPISVDPTTLPPLTTSQKNLRTKVRFVLKHYYERPLNTRDRSPWELMHALLAYEVDSKVLLGGPQGPETSAVGWLCFNQDCKRRTLMYVNDEGELQVRVGPALQGHRGQLLAMLAQSKVSKDYPLQVEGHELTVSDLVKMEMKTCYPRTELTFKLIALMHYLNSDTTWMNDQGMQWDIPRLISEEMRQPVRGAACGGTHRLSGLTLAYKTRQQRGEPIDGEYLKAQQFVQRYQQYAYRLQNRDGSLSTEWFRGPGNEQSLDRKLKTTGHLLEWLLYAASEQELHHSKTTRAADYLASILYNNRYKDWEAGPLGHAIHALLIYDRRVFAPYDKLESLPVAGKTKAPATGNTKR